MLLFLLIPGASKVQVRQDRVSQGQSELIIKVKQQVSVFRSNSVKMQFL